MINALLLSLPLWSRLTARCMLWWNEAHEHAQPVQAGRFPWSDFHTRIFLATLQAHGSPGFAPREILHASLDFSSRFSENTENCSRVPLSHRLLAFKPARRAEPRRGDKAPHRRHKSKNLVSLTQAKTFMPHSECFAKTLGPALMRCVAAVQPPEKQEGSLPAI